MAPPLGWPADPGVQPVARPVKKKCLGGSSRVGFFFVQPGWWPGFSSPGPQPYMECGTSEVPYDPLAMKSFGNREIASCWAGISVGHGIFLSVAILILQSSVCIVYKK